SRRRHTRFSRDWSSDVCSSDLRFGRQYRLYMQADIEYRAEPESFKSIFVRNNKNEMVPANTIIKLRKVMGPEIVNRYNLYNAIEIGRASCRQSLVIGAPGITKT